LTELTDVDESSRSFGYDGELLTSDSWDPLDAQFTYNGETGLLSAVDRGLGSVSSITSAAQAALQTGPATHSNSLAATVTDGGQLTTLFRMDSAGRLLDRQRPDGAHETWARDGNGLVTDFTDARGLHTGYAYNAQGGLIRRDNPDGTHADFAYEFTFH